jgi:hypothetical protein
MDRRAFITLTSLGTLGLAAEGFTAADTAPAALADLTITIAPVTVEFTPKLVFSTIGYNGSTR